MGVVFLSIYGHRLGVYLIQYKGRWAILWFNIRKRYSFWVGGSLILFMEKIFTLSGLVSESIYEEEKRVAMSGCTFKNHGWECFWVHIRKLEWHWVEVPLRLYIYRNEGVSLRRYMKMIVFSWVGRFILERVRFILLFFFKPMPLSIQHPTPPYRFTDFDTYCS